MLSLDNAFSFDALREWDRRVREGSGQEKIEYIAEHKFDGLSISLQYEDGMLARGVTRGDGTTGEDVTPNVKTIRSIPLRADAAALKKIKLRADFEVRGEVMMTRKAFDALNRQQEQIGGKIFRATRRRGRCVYSIHLSRPRGGWISSRTTCWWMEKCRLRSIRSPCRL
jgi:DNA ligase (NAD+)